MPDVLAPPPPTPRHAADPRRQHWLARRTAAPAWVLLIEVFIGLGWLRAAAEKVIDPAWWSGDVVRDLLDDHEGVSLPWYSVVEDGLVRPGMPWAVMFVVLAQAAIGASLLIGARRELALSAGIFLNLNFIAIGAVTPSAFYVLAQLAVLLWVVESRMGRAGGRAAAICCLVAGTGLSLLSAPFVSMLDPSTVIDDPAIMLVTLGVLTAASGLLLLDRRRDQSSLARYEYS